MAGSVLGQLELDAEAGDLLFKAIDSVLASERAHGNPVISSAVDSHEYTDISTATPAQRRADAMVALIRAGLDGLETMQPGRARTEVGVIVDYTTLVERATGTAQTWRGAPLPPNKYAALLRRQRAPHRDEGRQRTPGRRHPHPELHRCPTRGDVRTRPRLPVPSLWYQSPDGGAALPSIPLGAKPEAA